MFFYKYFVAKFETPAKYDQPYQPYLISLSMTK